MKGRRPGASIGAVVLLAGFLACGRSEGPGGFPPPEVLVATARLGTIPDHRQYVGNVRAEYRVEVRARVRGYLIAQRFVDGQRVTAGDVLFEIDPSQYQAVLGEAKGQLARAQAAARRSEHDFKRAQELYDAKVVSISVLDQRRESRDSALADVEAAKAAVRSADLNLSYCTVKAPLTGRIGRALVDVGNLVGESGQDTVLAQIVQVDPIRVYFAPTEGERVEVMRGTGEGGSPGRGSAPIPVQLELGDGTPYAQQGVVDYVDPTVEPTRGTVTVRARMPNPDEVLKPGQFVRVTAVFPDIPDAVLVPQRAVLDQQGGTYVLVVKQDDTVEQRPVQLGTLYQGMQQVKHGLAAGERVIADGVQKVRSGTKVVAKPVPETAEAAPAK